MQSAEESGTVAKPAAWWREPYVWLVISGPLAVVVASFVSAALAWNGADPLVDEDYYRKGLEINRSHEPALAGRNHSAELAAKPQAQARTQASPQSKTGQ